MLIAVRKIVEQVLRCGDIDSRFADGSAMLDGARAHRRIQREMGDRYKKEVYLKLDAEADGVPITLHGRADGVIEELDGSLTVDEIKTTTSSLARMYEQREVHMSQAKCYAHMLLAQSAKNEITIQLTYHHLPTGETQRHRFVYTKEELAEFFAWLLAAYGRFLRFSRDWRALRDESIRASGFPFPSYRKGQREMAVAAYSAVERARKLYVQAPTGTGKTLSALFPAIKALAEGKAEKLFYLTAKTVTRAVAEGALRQFGNLRLKSITLRAKDKLCFCEETNCTPDYCPFARGHFDRVNDALMDLLEQNDLITADVLSACAKEHRVCPHEFALDASEFADLVICDYNHVFDPRVYLRRFFSDAGGQYIFLVDEAHNLADRVRGMYTAALSKSAFDKLKRLLGEKDDARLKRTALSVSRHFLAMRKLCEQNEEHTRVDKAFDPALLERASAFTQEAGAWLAVPEHRAHAAYEATLELHFASLAYIGIAEGYDEAYTSIIERERNDVTHTLFCLDPSGIIGARLSFARASILFSATLTPLPYYRDMLGGTDTDGMLSLPSPFEEQHLLLMAHYGISTKYADRKQSVAPVVEAIHGLVAQRRGNYIAFFPSYEYLKEVYAQFCGAYPGIATLVQQNTMDENARAAFLQRFDAENAQTLLGFCVLGGIFGEGIDLTGERLVGAIVVGVGMPKLSLRQNLIRAYFDEKNGAGFDYAYVYPGMNKVLQAVGRVIRTEQDRGVALLIDSRFNTGKYRALYPLHWAHMRMVLHSGELSRLAAHFFDDINAP